MTDKVKIYCSECSEFMYTQPPEYSCEGAMCNDCKLAAHEAAAEGAIDILTPLLLKVRGIAENLLANEPLKIGVVENVHDDKGDSFIRIVLLQDKPLIQVPGQEDKFITVNEVFTEIMAQHGVHGVRVAYA